MPVGDIRFREDRAGLAADAARIGAGNRAEWAAAEARRTTRLKGLTADRLLSETPPSGFGNPLPETFVSEARARVRAPQAALADPGPKPRRPVVRGVLEARTEWFDTREAQIDTVEREALFEHLEELCWATGQKPWWPKSTSGGPVRRAL